MKTCSCFWSLLQDALEGNSCHFYEMPGMSLLWHKPNGKSHQSLLSVDPGETISCAQKLNLAINMTSPQTTLKLWTLELWSTLATPPNILHNNIVLDDKNWPTWALISQTEDNQPRTNPLIFWTIKTTRFQPPVNPSEDTNSLKTSTFKNGTANTLWISQENIQMLMDTMNIE